MIKMQAIGHLGKDCTVGEANGSNVINFNVAHSEKWTDGQGVSHERTVWIDCSLWKEKTGIAQYLKKGTQVYVEGTPEARSYTANDGTAKATLSLKVFNVYLLGGAKQQDGQNARPPEAQPQSKTAPTAEDDLPF